MKDNFKQIHHNTAKKLYKQGIDIYILPSKLNIYNDWPMVSYISGDFETHCNAYRLCNCCYQFGYNLRYYIKEL